MNHDSVSELLGAYALDAVDTDEAAAVREHLAGCPRCRDEVCQFQQAAAMLASSGGEAPAELWSAIAARIEQPARPGTALPPQLRFPAEFPEQRAARSPQRRRRARIAVMATLAAGVAAIGLLGIQVERLNHRVNQVRALSARQGLSAAAQSALLDPQARRIRLESTTNPAQPAGEIVTVGSGAAYFFNGELPALSGHDTYQLWAMVDGKAISVGLLGTHPATVAFSVDGANSAATFAVTVEPAGGSTTPTRPPVARTI